MQLQLQALSAPEAAPPLVDTLVMSNLGYFQLKAGPGLWKLKLAPGAAAGLPRSGAASFCGLAAAQQCAASFRARRRTCMAASGRRPAQAPWVSRP